MLRRDFFATVAKASIDLLGNNPFHGSLENFQYTFLPSKKRNAATLLVVGVRLNDSIYTNEFNIILMAKWPENKDIRFWRKLLIRHDLTDELHVICFNLPYSPPSFMKKAIWLGKGNPLSHGGSAMLPVLLVVSSENAEPRLLDSIKHFASGSDVFVTHPGGLNIKNSPAFNRALGFLL